MNELIQIGPISPLRQRLIDDMTMRRFSKETQRNYLRDVGRFATWLGRSPHTASAEDIRTPRLPAPGPRSRRPLPPPVPHPAARAARRRQARFLWQPHASRRTTRIPAAPVTGSEEALGRLCQAAVRGSRGRARLSFTLHPPGRHIEHAFSLESGFSRMKLPRIDLSRSRMHTRRSSNAKSTSTETHPPAGCIRARR